MRRRSLFAIASDPDAHVSPVPLWVAAPPYNSSKAALNMVTTLYARAFPKMCLNAVDTGHTATDLHNHTGAQRVQEGADIIVRMAMVGPDAWMGLRTMDAKPTDIRLTASPERATPSRRQPT